MFDIKEMISELGKNGVAKKSHFDLQITAPSGVEGAGNDIARSLKVRCDSVIIPGRETVVGDVDYYILNQSMAVKPVFQPITATFVMSKEFQEKIFFERWKRLMIGSRTGNGDSPGYNVGYYDDYVGTVNINQYDDKGKVVYSTELVNAYPIEILELSNSWDSNEIHKLSIVFKYHYYVEDRNPRS